MGDINKPAPCGPAVISHGGDRSAFRLPFAKRPKEKRDERWNLKDAVRDGVTSARYGVTSARYGRDEAPGFGADAAGEEASQRAASPRRPPRTAAASTQKLTPPKQDQIWREYVQTEMRGVQEW